MGTPQYPNTLVSATLSRQWKADELWEALYKAKYNCPVWDHAKGLIINNRGFSFEILIEDDDAKANVLAKGLELGGETVMLRPYKAVFATLRNVPLEATKTDVLNVVRNLGWAVSGPLPLTKVSPQYEYRPGDNREVLTGRWVCMLEKHPVLQKDSNGNTLFRARAFGGRMISFFISFDRPPRVARDVPPRNGTGSRPLVNGTPPQAKFSAPLPVPDQPIPPDNGEGLHAKAAATDTGEPKGPRPMAAKTANTASAPLSPTATAPNDVTEEQREHMGTTKHDGQAKLDSPKATPKTTPQSCKVAVNSSNNEDISESLPHASNLPDQQNCEPPPVGDETPATPSSGDQERADSSRKKKQKKKKRKKQQEGFLTERPGTANQPLKDKKDLTSPHHALTDSAIKTTQLVFKYTQTKCALKFYKMVLSKLTESTRYPQANYPPPDMRPVTGKKAQALKGSWYEAHVRVPDTAAKQLLRRGLFDKEKITVTPASSPREKQPEYGLIIPHLPLSTTKTQILATLQEEFGVETGLMDHCDLTIIESGTSKTYRFHAPKPVLHKFLDRYVTMDGQRYTIQAACNRDGPARQNPTPPAAVDDNGPQSTDDDQLVEMEIDRAPQQTVVATSQEIIPITVVNSSTQVNYSITIESPKLAECYSNSEWLKTPAEDRLGLLEPEVKSNFALGALKIRSNDNDVEATGNEAPGLGTQNHGQPEKVDDSATPYPATHPSGSRESLYDQENQPDTAAEPSALAHTGNGDLGVKGRQELDPQEEVPLAEPPSLIEAEPVVDPAKGMEQTADPSNLTRENEALKDQHVCSSQVASDITLKDPQNPQEGQLDRSPPQTGPLQAAEVIEFMTEPELGLDQTASSQSPLPPTYPSGLLGVEEDPVEEIDLGLSRVLSDPSRINLVQYSPSSTSQDTENQDDPPAELPVPDCNCNESNDTEERQALHPREEGPQAEPPSLSWAEPVVDPAKGVDQTAAPLGRIVSGSDPQKLQGRQEVNPDTNPSQTESPLAVELIESAVEPIHGLDQTAAQPHLDKGENRSPEEGIKLSLVEHSDSDSTAEEKAASSAAAPQKSAPLQHQKGADVIASACDPRLVADEHPAAQKMGEASAAPPEIDNTKSRPDKGYMAIVSGHSVHPQEDGLQTASAATRPGTKSVVDPAEGVEQTASHSPHNPEAEHFEENDNLSLEASGSLLQPNSVGKNIARSETDIDSESGSEMEEGEALHTAQWPQARQKRSRGKASDDSGTTKRKLRKTPNVSLKPRSTNIEHLQTSGDVVRLIENSHTRYRTHEKSQADDLLTQIGLTSNPASVASKWQARGGKLHPKLLLEQLICNNFSFNAITSDESHPVTSYDLIQAAAHLLYNLVGSTEVMVDKWKSASLPLPKPVGVLWRKLCKGNLTHNFPPEKLAQVVREVTGRQLDLDAFKSIVKAVSLDTLRHRMQKHTSKTGKTGSSSKRK